jgi:hypothetical protein
MWNEQTGRRGEEKDEKPSVVIVAVMRLNAVLCRSAACAGYEQCPRDIFGLLAAARSSCGRGEFIEYSL